MSPAPPPTTSRTSPSELPPPIPVRSVKPSISDIVSEAAYHDFGGGVNPLGYKGHAFHEHGYGAPSPASPRAPSSFKFSAARRPTVPVYNFDDDDDEYVLSVSDRTSKIPNSPPAPPPARPDDRPADDFLCCPLFGSISPFVASITLSHVGSSTVLPDNAYLVWRIFLLLATFAVFVTTAVQNIKFLAYAQGAALVFTLLCNILLLRRTLLYRHLRKDYDAIVSPTSLFGWNAFLYQGALQLALMVPVSYFIHSLFVPDEEVLAGGEYVGSLESFLLLALTAVHIFDVFITPIPFRATHILPVALYSMILSLVTMWSSQGSFSSVAIILVFLAGLVTGTALHLMGRAFYLTFHQKRIAAENLITPVVPDPYLDKV